jgi:hypothetical protein
MDEPVWIGRRVSFQKLVDWRQICLAECVYIHGLALVASSCKILSSWREHVWQLEFYSALFGHFYIAGTLGLLLELTRLLWRTRHKVRGL